LSDAYGGAGVTYNIYSINDVLIAVEQGIDFPS
jgi:hypothetical protein